MKISIIMCVKNSMPYIMSSIESFKKQEYKNKELIIINSKSKDNTNEFLKTINGKNIRKYNFNGSIYKSLNFGITKSKGHIIGVLHSDDIFFSKFILSKIAKEYKKSKSDIIYGNILFSKKNNLLNIRRSWSNINIKEKYDIPPHTGTFITKKICKKFKYNEKYQISADTDFLIKIFKEKFKFKYINEYITIMRIGGLSNNIFFLFKKISEDLNIFKNHNLTIMNYIKKILLKINQFFSKKKLPRTNYHSNLNNYSKVQFINLNNFNNINGKIIAALNLAFITYNYKFYLRTHNYLFWPDGIFSTYMTAIKKIPGREFFKNFLNEINKNKKKFKKIFILGNLPLISKIWLKNNLNYPFEHKKLPYGNFDKIKRKLKKIDFIDQSLIILTLPTPSQELIANSILRKNPKTNVICIGGSINILSGYEKETPQILYHLNLEWIWRLRFDTKRRLFRLLESGFLFLKLKLSGKNNIF